LCAASEGNKIHLFNRDISLQIADVAVASYMFWMVGRVVGWWAVGQVICNFSLAGRHRAASSIISYELTMGITLIALPNAFRNVKPYKNNGRSANGSLVVCYRQPLGFLFSHFVPLLKQIVHLSIYLG